MFEVTDLHSYYGLSHVLQGISLKVDGGEVACLLGRNGTGKSTTLKSIMGITPPRREGRVRYKESDLTGMSPEAIARSGIAYVPEERRIFPDLSVFENLKIPQLYSIARKNGWSLDKIYRLFPILETRKQSLGSQLSGGEQQMLAIARALIANPELILMDEPSEGLAPLLVQLVADTIREIKDDNISVLLVEQNFDMAIELGNTFYILNKGQIVFSGSREEILKEDKARKQYLSV
ncbi:MAG: ABC transporter ATP-binding protein [Deltaproteobacteria bacterium]|nr:ABC transporter ATP-binding protein [Deltaproteobacteria bacterium]MBW2110091.1 ABC transporter ATP-binding protein [Deltaproteobacteria bacterium]